MARTDIYQQITDRIIAALEEGTVPWKRPWKISRPRNVENGRPYNGINVLLLGLQEYTDPRWGTYKAIKRVGGQVRRGEKGTQIVLLKYVEKKVDDEDKSYSFMKWFTVFNAEQADDIPELPDERREHTPIEVCESIVNGYVYSWPDGAGNVGPEVTHGGDAAVYIPTTDKVQMPIPEVFDSGEAYYGALFHELVHSTGHEKRLGRIEPALFGSDPYALEELVAEIGASFLSGIAGLEIAGGEMSAAYIANWLQKFNDDRKFVVQAAAQAQKAVDLMIAETPIPVPAEPALAAA